MGGLRFPHRVNGVTQHWLAPSVPVRVNVVADPPRIVETVTQTVIQTVIERRPWRDRAVGAAMTALLWSLTHLWWVLR